MNTFLFFFWNFLNALNILQIVGVMSIIFSLRLKAQLQWQHWLEITLQE